MKTKTLNMASVSGAKKSGTGKSLRKRLYEQRYLIILLLPGLIFYIIFEYVPIYGIIIAFKEYSYHEGIFGSPWVGLRHFERFVTGIYFFRLVRNTLILSLYSIIFGFPIPIIFALLLNEIRNKTFKRLTQTISYLPHFIALVIVVGLLKQMLSPTSGIVNNILVALGRQPVNFFMEKEWFRTLFISSNIWQNFGWSAIIYIAALSNIDPQLYESAVMDGAGRWRCMWHITLPGMKSTIIILFILRIGRVLKIGFQKVLLMYNVNIYETADVISTYVYRTGIEKANFSFGTAIGLMNSAVALFLIVLANYISRRYSETSLW